jgi:hypothetical protein
MTSIGRWVTAERPLRGPERDDLLQVFFDKTKPKSKASAIMTGSNQVRSPLNAAMHAFLMIPPVLGWPM